MVPWLPFWITREWIYPSLRSTNATSVMYLAELKHFNSLQSAHWVDSSPPLRIIFACVRPWFSRKIAQIARMSHQFFLLIRNIYIYVYICVCKYINIYTWHPFFPISKWICLPIYLSIHLSIHPSIYVYIYIISTYLQGEPNDRPPTSDLWNLSRWIRSIAWLIHGFQLGNLWFGDWHRSLGKL